MLDKTAALLLMDSGAKSMFNKAGLVGLSKGRAKIMFEGAQTEVVSQDHP